MHHDHKKITLNRKSDSHKQIIRDLHTNLVEIFCFNSIIVCPVCHITELHVQAMVVLEPEQPNVLCHLKLF